jgi:hypothetical protein
MRVHEIRLKLFEQSLQANPLLPFKPRILSRESLSHPLELPREWPAILAFAGSEKTYIPLWVWLIGYTIASNEANHAARQLIHLPDNERLRWLQIPLHERNDPKWCGDVLSQILTPAHTIVHTTKKTADSVRQDAPP